MPILTNWSIHLTAEEVFRNQHTDIEVIRKRRPAIVAMTEDGVQQAAARVHPTVVFRRLAVEGVDPEGVTLEGGFRLTGSFLAKQLTGAEEVVAAVCTIGPAVEDLASELMANSKHVEGYAVDSAGIVAVGQVTDQFYASLEVEAKSAGKTISYRFSPGLPAWTVAQGQPELFAILKDINTAVELHPSMQMVPVKSLSFVVGIGKELVRRGNECAFCGMRDRCTYRSEHEKLKAGDSCVRREHTVEAVHAGN